MSDLGAIFHVTADGKQYDAHAYTTLDECPEPNLKIKFKGSPAYIKLEAKGSGGVPCYVRNKAGNIFQVKKKGSVNPFFTVTAEFDETKGEEDNKKYAFYSCGFRQPFSPDSNKTFLGSITPQEIDGFKILELQDQGYSEIDVTSGDRFNYNSFYATANRKCILHIKGNDYKLTNFQSKGNFFYNDDTGSPIGIKDKEQITVTYTLL